MESLKGICANNESPAAVALLHPQWLAVEFGPWCWNYDADYGAATWALHLENRVPLAQDIALAIQHNAYDGWWMCLNEPDLVPLTPKTAAELCAAQMRAVLAEDANAKFCVAGLSQLNVPTRGKLWLPRFWERLDADVKPFVKAVHVHFYPQADGYDGDAALGAVLVRQYLKPLKSWVRQNLGEDVGLWLSELGLAAFSPAEERVAQYLADANTEIDKFSERWAWYSQSKLDGYSAQNPYGYTTLQHPGTATNTALGEQFAGL